MSPKRRVLYPSFRNRSVGLAGSEGSKQSDIVQESCRTARRNRTGIIFIKERCFAMLKKDLISLNPFRMMGYENDDILDAGEFGAVLARAGVGKTAFLVQLSLNALLRSKNVLHISLKDPVHKVDLWYKEVFHLIAEQYHLNQLDALWESILPHRFIMTFKVEGFSVPKLEERLSDLIEQNIFSPQMIIVDGLPFNDTVRRPLSDLKELVKKYGTHAWFAVTTHRHEPPAADGCPVQLEHAAGLIDLAIQLLPAGKEIHLKILKGVKPASGDGDLSLDPATLLIKKRA
jgi:hypothetical protein